MRVGFVQNGDVTTNTAEYNTQGVMLMSDLQGQSFLDTRQDFGASPYYSAEARSTFFDPSPGNTSKTISADDTPRSGPPLTYDRGIGVEANDDVVDSMNLVWDFRLYVTVRTDDSRRIGPQVYTSRAWAQWQFNASGSIGQIAPYAWTAASQAGVNAPTSWTPETSGSQPPQLAGELFNDALGRETFN